uniref:Uncharacterized protein n=1 Tax=Equus asinus asinus TaxID=83772 RepID=A0A8C4MPE9_EQUAS
IPHINNYMKLCGVCLSLFFKQMKCLVSSLYLQVDLTRSFSFQNSKQRYTGILILASKVDTVGTFEMARVLCKVGLPSCPPLNGVQFMWSDYRGLCIPIPRPGQLSGSQQSGCSHLLFSPVLSSLYWISSKGHLS